MKFSFFHQRHAMSTSFDIFMVTYRVTNFLPKLIDLLLFSVEKTEFPFFEIPYFRVLPTWPHAISIAFVLVPQTGRSSRAILFRILSNFIWVLSGLS